MDPLGMATSFERTFGIPVPGWFLVLLTLAAIILLVGAVIRETAQGVKWLRAAGTASHLKARLQRVAASDWFRVAFSFRFLFRVAVSLWVIWISVAMWRMTDSMERYVLPRRLTEAQKATVAAVLSKAKPHDARMLVLQHDEEASSYRADFQQAIERGGWPVISIDYSRDVPEGVRIEFMQPFQGGKTNEDLARERVNPSRETRPNEVLMRALREAGILIQSFGGGGSSPNITTSTLTVSFGARRRDFYSIPREVKR